MHMYYFVVSAGNVVSSKAYYGKSYYVLLIVLPEIWNRRLFSTLCVSFINDLVQV